MSSDSHKAQTGIQPSIVHSQLGEAFYDNVTPACFNQHILRYRHNMAASLIGLDGLDDEKWCDHFC